VTCVEKKGKPTEKKLRDRLHSCSAQPAIQLLGHEKLLENKNSEKEKDTAKIVSAAQLGKCILASLSAAKKRWTDRYSLRAADR